MPLDVSKSKTDAKNASSSLLPQLISFLRWILITGLPIKTFRFWLVAGLLLGCGLLGIFVQPHWMGWIGGVFIASSALLTLSLEYIQQIFSGSHHENGLSCSKRIDSLQADVEALQSLLDRVDLAPREIMEIKQSIYYLVAATDELRKVYNARLEDEARM